MNDAAQKEKISKTVESITHAEASRKNIPTTAEYQSVMRKDEESPARRRRVKWPNYMTEMPKRKLLEQKLHKAVESAQKRLEAKAAEGNTECK